MITTSSSTCLGPPYEERGLLPTLSQSRTELERLKCRQHQPEPDVFELCHQMNQGTMINNKEGGREGGPWYISREGGGGVSFYITFYFV